MPLSVREAYEVLGIRPGADRHSIKMAHRRLVKRWHPDQFTDEKKRAEAEKKIKKINGAYNRIRTLKKFQRLAREAPESSTAPKSRESTSTKRPKQADRADSKERRKKSSAARSSSSRKKKEKDNRPEFSRSRFQDFLARINNRVQKKRLQHRKKRKAQEFEKEIIRNQKRWEHARQAFDDSTRVGMYKSFINSVIFGRIELLTGMTSDVTSLGTYNMRDKYELELRHSLIQDKIFYAVNNRINTFFKFSLGFGLFMYFIYNIMYFFWDGQLLYGFGEFAAAQGYVIGLIAILILPDNIYQRYLLWKHRNLTLKEIESTFDSRKLPSPYEAIKYGILITKYGLLALLILV